ncbi:hypothetical protein [Micromonospora sp. WMMD975]|uniref:hypothetical protein n=1 Tax=Micromonospora sp. WMMD975 TaxID=3016087 RepID=UPI00249C6E76|nr:hypothetical protein [Micromonospora sp. WMMD975]WFE34358.1 hypothetical protein O7613_02880 [Micromonospora sp. WMMD975]
MVLNGGDILLVTRAASVQFTKPIRFRVIRDVTDAATFDGWRWVEGYELDAKGEAVRRRRIFVQSKGLRVERRAVGDGRVRLPAR